MASLKVAFLAAAAVVCALAQDYDGPSPDDIQRLMARDVEMPMPPMAYGQKYISGGAGEGAQALEPNGEFKERHEVKTDNALPAYCNPPNPCPKGYHPDHDNCMSSMDFENTAEFSKAYQESQDCVCDQEHMRSCEAGATDTATTAEDGLNNEIDAALETYLSQQNDMHHPEVMAKKFMAAVKEMRAMELPEDEEAMGDSVLTHRAKKNGEQFQGIADDFIL